MSRPIRSVPRLVVDAVVLHRGKIVLVRRAFEPGKGELAAPGGFVELGESTEDAIVREVFEETGLRVRVERLLGVYGDPHRSPWGHVVAAVYVVRSHGGRLKPSRESPEIVLVPMRGPYPRLMCDHGRFLSDFRRTARLRT